MIKVNGKERSWRANLTISALLKEMGCCEDDYTLVILNGRCLFSKDYGRVFIPDCSEVRLISLVAGG